jgi:hypothetical protein
LHFQRYAAPSQLVLDLRVDALLVELPDQVGCLRDGRAIHGNQFVCGFYSSTLSRSLRMDALGFESPVLFHPPDPVIRDCQFSFLLEVQPGEDDYRHGEEPEQEGSDSDLELFAQAKG